MVQKVGKLLVFRYANESIHLQEAIGEIKMLIGFFAALLCEQSFLSTSEIEIKLLKREVEAKKNCTKSN